MASKAAYKRLTKEYVNMQKEPPPFVWAVPDEKNILTWNYIIRGPPDSPFAGGEYHGVLMFPAEYPFKPPGIKMYTPSGRFQPDKKICFSMSDFHPGSWNPAWSVATILTGLLSFMLSDELTTGSVTSSDSDKRAYAARSHAWNIGQRKFKDAFSDYCTPTLRDLPNMGEKERGRAATPERSTLTQPQPHDAAPCPSPSPSPATPSASSQLSHRVIADTHTAASSSAGGDKPKGTVGAGWAEAWRQVIWEKWRWGLLIALAVIVSRVSSSN